MSRYSVRHPQTGEWHDLIWRKWYLGYTLWWGPHQIGQIRRPYGSRVGWSGQSLRHPSRPLGGFRTRWDATEYILKVDEFWPWMSTDEWDQDAQKWYSPTKRMLKELAAIISES